MPWPVLSPRPRCQNPPFVASCAHGTRGFGAHRTVQLIPYANLASPEVARLPWDLPLLIPLGLDEYDLAEAGKLLQADQAVLLPAIPTASARWMMARWAG
ncbi:MAG: hypothetical protein Kow0047_06570 [Anaerolineae bacterium]